MYIIRTWYHFRGWKVIMTKDYSKNMKNLPRPRKWISYGHFRGLGHFRGPRRPRKWIYYSHFRGLGNWVWNFPFCDFISKFSFPTWKWPISHLERIRDGIFPPWVAKPRRRKKKFPRESRKAHPRFPMNGLAGIVKNNFPMSGEAANGELLFYYDC